MTEQMISPPPQGEPELKRNVFDPKGVFQKNAKPLMYLGVALLVIIAAIFSSHANPATGKAASVPNQPPQPMVQDNTDNNIQDLKNQLAAERQREAEQAAQQSVTDPAIALATPAQRSAASSYSATGQPVPCVPGQPCMQPPAYGYSQQGGGAGQQTPAQQASQQIEAKDRQRAYDSRFSSNLAYRRPADPPSSGQGTQGSAVPVSYPLSSTPQAGGDQPSTLVSPRAAGEAPAGQGSIKRSPEVNIDSAVGQPYVLYEGTTLDAVLMNRLDGDAVGPVKVLVSNPVYSHDRQHVLVPEGTIVLGEARKIGSSGFGQQRRMAVAFHRMIMPDGYSVDLDQFHGLDQIGEEGQKDKVNNHYLQIFGASIALGVIAGAAQISQGGGVYAGSGSQVFTNGASASVSQSATTVLDRFMQIPPTITIREGHRVKVYFTQDMLLPSYENHTIPGTF
ncbi:TrbI/VirB10 family protein [Edaphobacter aggregans]|uniref:TrbI/VirB10 family protein n=1 Tax=Edaphobacter aggregans TaxID=570835 RepID=UPI00068D3CB7|nr:TrbI/VirB10 family protein [Edaphobacter aggregans]